MSSLTPSSPPYSSANWAACFPCWSASFRQRCCCCAMLASAVARCCTERAASVRTLMYAAALQADWDPDEVSFVHTLNVIQRSQWRLRQTSSCQRPALRQALLHEVCQERVPPRRLRLQARVVKRTHSRYKRKWY